MSAFFSGTDDANENNNQFYTVWGKVENDEPEIAFRYVSGEEKVVVSPRTLFEWPFIKEVTSKHIVGGEEFIDVDSPYFFEDEIKYTPIVGPFKQVDYPEDWLDQHEKKIYTAKKPYGYSSGYYQYGANKTGGKQRNLGKEQSAGSEVYYGSEQYWLDYFGEEEEENYDELETLEVYPDNGSRHFVSPELNLAVKLFLSKVREKDCELYNSLYNN